MIWNDNSLLYLIDLTDIQFIDIRRFFDNSLVFFDVVKELVREILEIFRYDPQRWYSR